MLTAKDLFRSLIFTSAVLALLSVPKGAEAKKVICIDGAADGFLANKEGYLRALYSFPGNVFSVGGSLTDCLAQVQNGDELIVVTHGCENGSFTWGGNVYTGFGNAQGLMPVPDGFANLHSVNTLFCACYSHLDPDGDGGPDKSMSHKLRDAMGGTASSNTATGFIDVVTAGVRYIPRGGTAAQRDAAIRCLEENGAWLNNPPVNRPGAATTQQSAANAQLSLLNCPDAGGAVTVEIPNRVGAQGSAGYMPPRAEQPPNVRACGLCPDCGCVEAEAVEEPVPAVPATWSNLKLRYR